MCNPYVVVGLRDQFQIIVIWYELNRKLFFFSSWESGGWMLVLLHIFESLGAIISFEGFPGKIAAERNWQSIKSNQFIDYLSLALSWFANANLAAFSCNLANLFSY